MAPFDHLALTSLGDPDNARVVEDALVVLATMSWCRCDHDRPGYDHCRSEHQPAVIEGLQVDGSRSPTAQERPNRRQEWALIFADIRPVSSEPLNVLNRVAPGQEIAGPDRILVSVPRATIVL